MSQPSDLRTWWDTAIPGERDKRVALALGWTFKPMLADKSRKTWHDPNGHAKNLPAFTTSWEHAGPLLDRLHGAGWTLEILTARVYPGDARPRWRVHAYGLVEKLPEVHGFGETAREAIALAFCLAMEAQA